MIDKGGIYIKIVFSIFLIIGIIFFITAFVYNRKNSIIEKMEEVRAFKPVRNEAELIYANIGKESKSIKKARLPKQERENKVTQSLEAQNDDFSDIKENQKKSFNKVTEKEEPLKRGSFLNGTLEETEMLKEENQDLNITEILLEKTEILYDGTEVLFSNEKKGEKDGK